MVTNDFASLFGSWQTVGGLLQDVTRRRFEWCGEWAPQDSNL